MKRKRRNAWALWLAIASALCGLLWLWRAGNPLLHRPVASGLPTPAAPPTPGQAESNAPPSPAPQTRPPASVPSIANQSDRAVADSSIQNLPAVYPRPVRNAFELQLALARQALSPGSLDGVPGRQTRSAIAAFQTKRHLPITGELDEATRQDLLLTAAPMTTYVISSNDLARLQPVGETWLAKSQQSALDYESILELVSEKAQSSPNLIRRLNPALNWQSISTGTCVQVPDIGMPTLSGRSAFVTIRLSEKVLEAWDESTNLMAHFPCSIARLVEKRPVGELHVEVIVHHPNYTFDPANFPESPEAQELKTKLILPPGPNNPVGTAWIGLDKPGYGIHGTPHPEQVGRTESHGCFRLANWNVECLANLVTVGTPVRVEP